MEKQNNWSVGLTEVAYLKYAFIICQVFILDLLSKQNGNNRIIGLLV